MYFKAFNLDLEESYWFVWLGSVWKGVWCLRVEKSKEQEIIH